MPRKCLEMVSATDSGMLRAFNEDSLGIDLDAGVMALADGMGGHQAGEVASRMATSIILMELKNRVANLSPAISSYALEQTVNEVVEQANRAIFETTRQRQAEPAMGTTLALTLFFNNQAILAHVGDSRIYRIRNNRLKLLTRDDSLLREQVELGVLSAQEAGASRNRSLVTQALGLRQEVTVHLQRQDALPGDIFLLCSDGLNDLVEDEEIELIITSLQANLALAADHLVQLANDYGGHDNISVVLAKVLEPFPATDRSSWLDKLFSWMR